MVTSSPDKTGTLIGHSVNHTLTILAGCHFRLTCNSPVCHVPRANGPGEHATLADRLHRWLPGCMGPKSCPGSGTPLEFLIPAISDDYLDLSHWYLYLKCRVPKADGSHIETLKADASQGTDSSVGPVNLLFHSLLRQGELVMNDDLVAMGGDTYPYRACLMMLLSYGCGAKETWLMHLEGWWTDEEGKYNAQENVSLINCRETISNSRTCCCKRKQNECPVGAVT